MDVLVFGAGSLGSLMGGILAREHDVTLIGTNPHMAAIQHHGLRITGELTRTVHPVARTSLPDSSFDLAIVTVKSFDTLTAAKSLAGIDLTAVLSLQNGMGNEEQLAEHVRCPVLAGVTTYGAMQSDPGVVRCTGQGTITLGSFDANGSLAARVGRWFRAAGLTTEVSEQIRTRLWEKLAINAGINPTTALARVQNGSLKTGALNAIAVCAARETAGVARTRGIELTGQQVEDALTDVIASTAHNNSSMLQDVTAGQRTEIDAINGYVVTHTPHDVPVNEVLTQLIRGWERARDLR